MEKLFENKNFHLGLCLVMAVLVIGIYSNTFNASFHFDDTPQIVDNYKLRDIKNIPDLLTDARGVTMATFAINYAIGGQDVTSYHVFNIAIHIINGVLAYFVLFYLLSMVREDEAWAKKIAAFSALLFAVHPLQTQAVTYIVQRMESLASLFYLLAVLLFIKAVKTEDQKKRYILYGFITLVFVLGFKSKEIVITLPAILFLFDYFFVSKCEFSGLKQRAPLYGVLGVLLVYFIFTTVVPSGGFGDLSDESAGVSAKAEETELTAEERAATKDGKVELTKSKVQESAGFGVQSISPKEYLFTQFNVLVYYITLIFVPVNQNLDYDFPVSRGLFEMPKVHEGTVLNYPIPPPFVSLLILLAIVGWAVYNFKLYREDKDPLRLLITFFVLWFFIILSPTSSFVPIIDVIFEHRVYLAMLGVLTIFVILVDKLFDLLEQGQVSKK